MRHWIKNVVHNSVAHPLMPFLPSELGTELHDVTARWAFPHSQSSDRPEVEALYDAPKNTGKPRARYVLHVETGVHEANTLPVLLLGVMSHRFRHWRLGFGWVD